MMRGLKLTKRGELVKDTLIAAAVAGLFFPTMTLIIALAHTIGLN
jgi:hypothetical protein